MQRENRISDFGQAIITAEVGWAQFFRVPCPDDRWLKGWLGKYPLRTLLACFEFLTGDDFATTEQAAKMVTRTLRTVRYE